MQLSAFVQTSVKATDQTEILTNFVFLSAIRDPVQTRAEIISILAISDRLYSEVEENVPDPSPLSANRKDVETVLEQVHRNEEFLFGTENFSSVQRCRTFRRRQSS